MLPGEYFIQQSKGSQNHTTHTKLHKRMFIRALLQSRCFGFSSSALSGLSSERCLRPRPQSNAGNGKQIIGNKRNGCDLKVVAAWGRRDGEVIASQHPLTADWEQKAALPCRPPQFFYLSKSIQNAFEIVTV